MIGINVAVRVGAQGIGFAIPVDETMEIAARLLNSERLERVIHGVVGRTENVGSERRFVVTGIRENTAADRCGLRPADVIAAVEQTPIRRKLDFERALLGRRMGESLILAVVRNGERIKLDLVVSPAAELAGEFDKRAWNTFGMRLALVPSDDFRKLKTRYRGGLRVVSVRAGGPAAQQGIRPGDILVGMHVWETISRDNLIYILNHQDFERFQPTKFYVLRGKETLYGHMKLSRSTVVQVSRRLDRGN
jgi:serine protease Do